MNRIAIFVTIGSLVCASSAATGCDEAPASSPAAAPAAAPTPTSTAADGAAADKAVTEKAATPVAATTAIAPVAVAAPATGALADAALCALHGKAGATVDCALSMGGDGAALPPVAGLQLKLEWEANKLSFVGVASEICAPGGAGCQTMVSPPLKTVGSAGHTLVTSPAVPAEAKGALTLMLYHPKKPDSTLADVIGSLRFQLAADVSEDAAVVVRAVKVDATTPTAQPLTGRVDAGKLAIAGPY